LGFSATLASVFNRVAGAEVHHEHHGISAFGDLKYPADFKHFDYVNPTAPKNGLFSYVAPNKIFNQGILTFTTLNSFILKGDAAQGLEFTFASLMARAYDEPDAMYGLAARAVQISFDRLTYRFLMRRSITFHDGRPAKLLIGRLGLPGAPGDPVIPEVVARSKASPQRFEVLAAGLSKWRSRLWLARIGPPLCLILSDRNCLGTHAIGAAALRKTGMPVAGSERAARLSRCIA
jgi:hypothetical protein